MSSADEEAAALRELEAAIHRVRRAKGWDDLLTDWVLVGAAVEVAEDASGIEILHREGSMQFHSVIGLLRLAQIQTEHNYLRGQEE